MFLTSSGVTTDSRNIIKDSLFFALKGDNFDGNSFAGDALNSGAKCSVVDDKNLPDNPNFIKVNDVLSTLQELATYHRKQLKIPVIGLTGTNGKTTTKELISAVLSTKYKVCSTKGNFNNHIGVPLTILGINSDIEIAVIEMGASSKGEIELLSNISRPEYGLITNVGKAHLLGFGSLDGVMKTKGELYDYLYIHNGLAFYNADNPLLTNMISLREGLKTQTYGLELEGYTIKSTSEKDPFLKLQCPGGKLIKTNLIGNYNADNVIAALTIASHFGVDFLKAVDAIENYKPSNNRSQLMKGKHNTLIIDAYNANPTSMKASLENFKNLNTNNKALIIGDMLELGNESQKEHSLILEFIKELNPDKMYFVGKEFEKAAASDKYFQSNALFFENSLKLKDYIIKEPIKKHTILIKGSRGTRLENVIETL